MIPAPQLGEIEPMRSLLVYVHQSYLSSAQADTSGTRG